MSLDIILKSQNNFDDLDFIYDNYIFSEIIKKK